METVVKTEYQDIYRATSGVLLVVNKFEKDYSYGKYCYLHTTKDKPYNKLTKDLRILKDDKQYSRYDYDEKVDGVYVVPKGTVLYNSFPVNPTYDESKWVYEVKTTANCLSGSGIEVINMLNIIKETIRSNGV